MLRDIALRPYQPTDAQQVIALINAASQRTLGSEHAVVDAVGNLRLARYVPPSAVRVVAVDADSAVIGYSYLVARDHPAIQEMGGAVHPDWWGVGAGSLLIAWVQQQVLAQARQDTRGIKYVLQTNLFEAETDALHLFHSYNFAPVRTWLHFERTLTDALPQPSLPEGLHLRPMDLDKDWEIVGPAMDDAFSRHWGVILSG